MPSAISGMSLPRIEKRQLSSEQVFELIKELIQNPAIERLRLDSCEMDLAGAKLLGEFIQANTTIKELWFEGKIEAGGIKYLANGLKFNQSLQSLDLMRCHLGADGSKEIAEALQVNCTLKELRCWNNDMGCEGAGHLAEMLKTNPTLTSLWLTNNGIRIAGVNYLAAALRINQTLTDFDLSANKLRLSTESLSNSLKANQTLQQLKLRQCDLLPEDAKWLADSLSFNQSLQELDLGCNNIGAVGVKYLESGLKQNQTLRVLGLMGNNISAREAKHLASILKYNHSLWRLDISCNHINSEGAGLIAKALKTNQNLQKLDVDYNEIGSKGADYFANALRSNRVLQNLYLSGNKIGQKSAKNLVAALASNYSVKELNIFAEGEIDWNTKSEIESEIARFTARNQPKNYLYPDLSEPTVHTAIKAKRPYHKLLFAFLLVVTISLIILTWPVSLLPAAVGMAAAGMMAFTGMAAIIRKSYQLTHKKNESLLASDLPQPSSTTHTEVALSDAASNNQAIPALAIPPVSRPTNAATNAALGALTLFNPPSAKGLHVPDYLIESANSAPQQSLSLSNSS